MPLMGILDQQNIRGYPALQQQVGAINWASTMQPYLDPRGPIAQQPGVQQLANGSARVNPSGLRMQRVLGQLFRRPPNIYWGRTPQTPAPIGQRTIGRPQDDGVVRGANGAILGPSQRWW